MSKITSIAENHDNIFLVDIKKVDKHNKETWIYTPIDKKWKYGPICDYKMKAVPLHMDNTFFIAYKSHLGDKVIYFVDPKKSMYRNSVHSYVKSLINYSTYTNDISRTKNEPSFRLTKYDMEHEGIDNFIDLCYNYRDYSAIGTGLTRNIRNLIVMDIDVDCTRKENKEAIDNLLHTFAVYKAVPDFYIFNHDSKHIQLQWLVKDIAYKTVSKEIVENVTNEIMSELQNNIELNLGKIDFTNITKSGMDYRKFTLALCDIVPKRKFGDKNYTWWKAKNPMSALEGHYNLELKMPYIHMGEVKFMSESEMKWLFSTKENRRMYFEEAWDILELYRNLKELINPIVEKIKESRLNQDDDTDVTEIKETRKKKSKSENSRNSFVLDCTRNTTWDIAKKNGYKFPEQISRLDSNDFNKFKSKILKTVKRQFSTKDKEYNGIWPGTTNNTPFTKQEFNKTFETEFEWAIRKFKDLSYSNDDRKKSIESRQKKKNIKFLIVNQELSKKRKLTLDKFLIKVNKIIVEKGHKAISLTTLKRYINESKKCK